MAFAGQEQILQLEAHACATPGRLHRFTRVYGRPVKHLDYLWRER